MYRAVVREEYALPGESRVVAVKVGVRVCLRVSVPACLPACLPCVRPCQRHMAEMGGVDDGGRRGFD